MKNLEKLLCLESITRKDLKEEGFSDYEIREVSFRRSNRKNRYRNICK